MTTLALAVALDLLLGDPPNRWHPVAWIGRLIALGRRLAPTRPEDLALYGSFLILIVAGVAAGGALAAHALLGALPGIAAPLAQGWLLKCSLSLRGLPAAVEIVRGHLVAGDLAGARGQVAWHLVSRSTAGLDERRVASATIESLAENLTDGLVGPLCFYVAGALLGIPALIAPKRVSRVKQEPFECGKDPVQLPEGRFAIKFSTIAIFFILFDIELVFVWPWAMMYRRLGWFGFVEMVVFLGILMLGFLYIWKKRGLEWE